MCRASAAPGPPASCHCRSPEGMCPVVKDPDCFTPMICHCKVACTNNTLSLMFGCKVGRGSCLSNACCLPGGANSSFCCLFTRLPVGSVREARTCSALPGSRLGLGAERAHRFYGVRYWVGSSVVTAPRALIYRAFKNRLLLGKGAP